LGDCCDIGILDILIGSGVIEGSQLRVVV